MNIPKVGICGWVFGLITEEHILQTRPEHILKAAELGFESIELIVSTEKELNEYYTPGNIKKIAEICESKKIVISQFVVLTELLQSLTSFNEEEKKKAFMIFEKGAEIAKNLGTKIINTVSPWPRIEAPFWYVPNYIHPVQSEISRADIKLTIKLPEEVKNWDKYWRNFVNSIGHCVDIAADAGLYFSLEVHPNSIISSTDAMLLLINEIKSNNLGMNMDIGWHLAKREYIPLSIYRLRDRLFNIHVRDSDGLLQYNLPPPLGIINWEEVIKALKDVGYCGCMNFEIVAPGCESFQEYLLMGKEYLKKLITKFYK